MSLGNGLLRANDDDYVLTFAEHQTELHLERVRIERGELVGYLWIATGLPGARTIDHRIPGGTIVLSRPSSRREFSKLLAERLRTSGIDCIGMLDELEVRVTAAYQRGKPAIDLRTVPKPPPDQFFDVDGFPLLRRHDSIVFGDGGVLKSTFALRCAGRLAEQGRRVGVFDWELDESAHRLNLERLFGPRMPTVLYVRCDRPLVQEVDRLRRIVHEEGITDGFFDSAGFACPGPPEAAEHALGYFRACRQLRLESALHLAHVRQGENNDQKPFGSSFWHNSARATWFCKLASTSTDGQRLTIGLFNRKANLTALKPAVGYEVTFTDERTTFERVNVADVGELAESLPLWQRMRSALTHGPQTLARLAEDIGANVDTLDRTVRRKSGLFTRVPGKDGISRIALVESRVA